jgi:hypothetical protein
VTRTRRPLDLVSGALVALVVLAPTGCGSEQDPGVPAAPSGPVTTSVTLGACPPGGPDATTPPAGCLAEDGTVVRP